MLIWIALLGLILFSAASYAAGRRKVLSAAGHRPSLLHSLPGYYGAYLALWAAAPAALVLLLVSLMGAQVEELILRGDPPAAVSSLPASTQDVFYNDVVATVNDGQVSQTVYDGALGDAFNAKLVQAKDIHRNLTAAALSLAFVLALAGAAAAWPRLSADFAARPRVERWVAALFLACAVVAVLTTVGIVASLVWESWRFFQVVPLFEFLFGMTWDPQIAIRADQVASSGAFGAVPLFMGTFLIMMIAMTVAAPVGLFAAIYLSEYAGATTRAVVKPLLEILAGIPTVVYGFFAALTVGPLFRGFFNSLGAPLLGGPFDALGLYLMQVQNQMALVAGAVMGIMLIPFVSSLSDDIINAVPQSLRDGSLAMGATRSETITRVIMPAALPGVMGALLLAVSRAIGETMIVTMAAGLQARATINPLDTVTTVTVQIVTLLTGDQEFDSPKTLSAFGLGLTLFLITLMLNIVALRIVQRYREQYD
ncbi:MAG: phosphate ABC transporter permease subunit PstC [Phenylobacterium sp.]|uniref:phosphate ABC transporter permease subunit PstC n=1 Tax=Phenylobacterium sp. TaxID=1871053 RepID=UPI00271A9F3E|nr:phosphate ABC transporter permease subunit PstC [Phenylobacterium sp.]MDO8900615.1 phosphate ABC transporter permease subunit PstC [Phenylobacterium sp.]